MCNGWKRRVGELTECIVCVLLEGVRWKMKFEKRRGKNVGRYAR